MADDLFPELDRTVVRLDRSIDRERPCCENLATIHVRTGPHGAALRCASCGQHRGWLPKQATECLDDIANRFGNPAEPIVLRDNSIGDHELKKLDDKNRGTLFRNDRKDGDKSPDYKGSINIGGVEHWISGWIRQSKTGEKFMSLSVKPKEETAPAKKAPDQDFNDEIPF
jgi:uncharacterized protein (DUF736 family)